MGSYLSRHCQGKVVLPNGNVRELDRPVSVAELMLDHPQNLVVELRPSSSSPTKNSKLSPLPADHKLDPKRVYMMVPMARGNRSIEDACRAVQRARSSSTRFIIPWVGACMRATSEEEVAKEVLNDHEDEEEGGAKWEMMLCRQYSSRGWKPSLGTIEERIFEKKTMHWLL